MEKLEELFLNEMRAAFVPSRPKMTAASTPSMDESSNSVDFLFLKKIGKCCTVRGTFGCNGNNGSHVSYFNSSGRNLGRRGRGRHDVGCLSIGRLKETVSGGTRQKFPPFFFRFIKSPILPSFSPRDPLKKERKYISGLLSFSAD